MEAHLRLLADDAFRDGRIFPDKLVANLNHLVVERRRVVGPWVAWIIDEGWPYGIAEAGDSSTIGFVYQALRLFFHQCLVVFGNLRGWVLLRRGGHGGRVMSLRSSILRTVRMIRQRINCRLLADGDCGLLTCPESDADKQCHDDSNEYRNVSKARLLLLDIALYFLHRLIAVSWIGCRASGYYLIIYMMVGQQLYNLADGIDVCSY